MSSERELHAHPLAISVRDNQQSRLPLSRSPAYRSRFLLALVGRDQPVQKLPLLDHPESLPRHPLLHPGIPLDRGRRPVSESTSR